MAGRYPGSYLDDLTAGAPWRPGRDRGASLVLRIPCARYHA